MSLQDFIAHDVLEEKKIESIGCVVTPKTLDFNFSIDQREFYVYVYLDPRKPGKYVYGEYEFDYEPFYVGKGHSNRCYEHFNEAEGLFNKLEKIKKSYNPFKIRKIHNIWREEGIVPIIKIKENLFENDAFNLEISLIKNIGRINLGTGPLVNLTDGGEGGIHSIVMSKESKNIIKLKQKKWRESLTDIQRKEISLNLSNRLKNRKLESNHKQNVSLGIKKWWNSLTDQQKLDRNKKISHYYKNNIKILESKQRKIYEKQIKKELKQKLIEEKRKLIEEQRKNQKPGMLGKHHSKETIEKIKNSNKGKIRSVEWIQKQRIAKLGKKLSVECIENQRKSMKNYWKNLSEERKLQIINNRIGRKRSEESKQRMSIAAKNRKGRK